MQITPNNAFAHDDLNELQWIFASVCEVLEAKHDKPDEEERACIRRRLFMLACNGMRDPLQLRDHLVRSFTRPKKVQSAA
jgi:hypothetical protein